MKLSSLCALPPQKLCICRYIDAEACCVVLVYICSFASGFEGVDAARADSDPTPCPTPCLDIVPAVCFAYSTSLVARFKSRSTGQEELKLLSFRRR